MVLVAITVELKWTKIPFFNSATLSWPLGTLLESWVSGLRSSWPCFLVVRVSAVRRPLLFLPRTEHKFESATAGVEESAAAAAAKNERKQAWLNKARLWGPRKQRRNYCFPLPCPILYSIRVKLLVLESSKFNLS